jgi:hypothetical protein
MRVMLWAPSVRRAAVRATMTAALLLASGSSLHLLAQEPAQPQQPAQPEQGAQAEAPQPPQLTFDADYVIWFYAVQSGRGNDFEQFFGRVREAMAKSEQPQRRQQAQGMKLLKATASAPDGTETYVLMINPVQRGQEYSPGMLLFEVFPSEAKELVDQLQAMINEKGLNAAVPMNTVLQLGGM